MQNAKTSLFMELISKFNLVHNINHSVSIIVKRMFLKCAGLIFNISWWMLPIEKICNLLLFNKILLSVYVIWTLHFGGPYLIKRGPLVKSLCNEFIYANFSTQTAFIASICNFYTYFISNHRLRCIMLYAIIMSIQAANLVVITQRLLVTQIW